MVASAQPQTAPPAAGAAPAVRKAAEPHVWLIPGETAWEVWGHTGSEQDALQRTLAEGDATPPARVDVVALPASLVTCQLFWLETAEEKAVPDLVRMQCERRQLLRQDEVWTHRVIRREGERSLVQVLILQNALPPFLQVGGEARFEAHARCLDLPPRSLAVWRSLGGICLALTGDQGIVHFQTLPHQTLGRECVRDVQSTLWLATAQNWVSRVDGIALAGTWSQQEISGLEGALELPVQKMAQPRLALPEAPMELLPHSVRQLRVTRRRQHRIKLVLLALGVVYALFFLFQLGGSFLINAQTRELQAKLNGLMPRVLDMQATARQLDALNPALDPATYPLEILRRAMAVLPETGVRLTSFDISAGKIQIEGESATAREAFDYMRNLETVKDLNHIHWDEAPQPIPLPNDTTRFSITGDVEGAYHDPEES